MAGRPGDGASPPVAELVRAWAARAPDALALVDASATAPRTWTWGQFSQQADDLAATLRGQGVRRGDVVALRLADGAEAVVLALGVLRAGAVCCTLATTSGARETRLALEACGARLLCTHAEAGARAMPGAPRRPQPLAPLPGIVAVPCTPPRPARAAGPGHLAFTSGTTGRPKAVLHRDATLTRAVRMAAARLGLARDDRVLVACPIAHHSGFLYGMWLAWVHGCAQVVTGRWDARRALAAAGRWVATFATLVPAHLADLAEAVEAGAPPAAGLRRCVVTGAPVTARLAERAERVLGVTVCRAWGSTETCMATLSDPAAAPAVRHASDGRPVDGVRLRVTGGDGRPLACGREGVLEVASSTLFAGYGTGPAFERGTFTRDGWHRTGDLARLDAAGRLRVTGRVADVVNRGGEKVPVAEVERLLAEHASVADVAVTGLPDARLGERACAFVVPAPGCAPALADLQRHLEARGVTRRHWPERVEIVDRLPRSAAGKVRKAALRQLAQATPAAGHTSALDHAGGGR